MRGLGGCTSWQARSLAGGNVVTECAEKCGLVTDICVVDSEPCSGGGCSKGYG